MQRRRKVQKNGINSQFLLYDKAPDIVINGQKVFHQAQCDGLPFSLDLSLHDLFPRLKTVLNGQFTSTKKVTAKVT
jgi:hypothetical protein